MQKKRPTAFLLHRFIRLHSVRLLSLFAVDQRIIFYIFLLIYHHLQTSSNKLSSLFFSSVHSVASLLSVSLESRYHSDSKSSLSVNPRSPRHNCVRRHLLCRDEITTLHQCPPNISEKRKRRKEKSENKSEQFRIIL
jgi:hypothetical protein